MTKLKLGVEWFEEQLALFNAASIAAGESNEAEPIPLEARGIDEEAFEMFKDKAVDALIEMVDKMPEEIAKLLNSLQDGPDVRIGLLAKSAIQVGFDFGYAAAMAQDPLELPDAPEEAS